MEKRRKVSSEQLEEVFSELWQLPGFGAHRGYRPQVDCYRSDEPPAVTVVVDLPGIEPDDVEITVRELQARRERGDDLVLIDVREPDEFASGHPVGARNVPLDQIEARLAGAVKNKTVPLLLICASGSRAQRAVAAAKKLGYEQAQAVAGGLKAWKEANLPVEKA